jgi:hypothetical protein
MQLHWATQHLESLLPPHLKARINEPRVDPHGDIMGPIPYQDGKTGEILGEVPTEEVTTRVSGMKLRRFFFRGRGPPCQSIQNPIFDEMTRVKAELFTDKVWQTSAIPDI